MTGPANPNLPQCAGCGDALPHESLNTESRCRDCADSEQARVLRAQAAERVAEFRNAARYWIAVRPVLLAPLHELVDAADVAAGYRVAS